MYKQIFGAVALCFSGLIWAEPTAIEDFAKWPEYHNAVLSPTGKYMAVQRSADEGKRLVAILETETLKLLSHIPATTGRSPYRPIWVSDKRVVVTFTEEFGSEFEYPTGELFAMNVDGKKRRDFVKHQQGVSRGKDKSLNGLHGFARVIHTLQEQPRRVLVQFYDWQEGDRPSKLLSIDTISGKVKMITRAPSMEAYITLSNTGEPLYSFGTNKKVKDENKAITHKYVDGKWQELRVDTIEGASRFNVIASTDVPSEVMLRVQYMDRPDRIFRYNVETGKKSVVFAHNVVDPSETQVDPYTNKLHAVHFDDGYPNIHLVDEQNTWASWYPALYGAFSGSRVRITSATADGEKLIVHVSSDREPGQFHLFDTKKKKLKYLFNAASWVNSESLAESKPVSFKARDGKEIHGYLTVPKSEKPVPLVVMPHGGPYGVRDTWRFDSEAQFLASRGYAVLQPNFRGSGGYGWGSEKKAWRKWGSEIQFDIIDGTKWAANLPEIDADKICIMGGSFGGYSALMSPTIEPDLYKCAIGMVGVYDLNLMWTTADIRTYYRGENFLEDAIGKDKDELNKFSPLKQVDKLKAPVLLVHGGRDWRVDVKHYHRMVAALKKKGHPHETLLKKKEGHGFFNEENRVEFLERVEAFLDKHIGASSESI